MDNWKACAEADEAEGTLLKDALADSHLDWKAAAPIDLMELMMHLSFEPQQKFLAAQLSIQLAKILELHWLEKGLGHGNGSKDDDIDFAWVEWAEILSKHADLDRKLASYTKSCQTSRSDWQHLLFGSDKGDGGGLPMLQTVMSFPDNEAFVAVPQVEALVLARTQRFACAVQRVAQRDFLGNFGV